MTPNGRLESPTRKVPPAEQRRGLPATGHGLVLAIVAVVAILFGDVTADKKACQNRTIYIYGRVPGDENSWDNDWDALEVTAAEGGGFTRYLSTADETDLVNPRR